MTDAGILLYHFAELNHISVLSVLDHQFSTEQPHRHDFFEFEYIMEGEIICRLNDQPWHLKAGDLVFMTPVDIHSYEPSGDSFVKTITVHFHIEDFDSHLMLTNLDSRIICCSEELKTALFWLRNEKNTKDTYSTLACKNLLERILILFLRSKTVLADAGPTDEIKKALSYISKNFHTAITLEDMSRICGYSAAHFCRVFKTVTGLTFVEYLNQMRLECARRMLFSFDIPILQICFDCGFGSVRHFNREFKKLYGLSPTQYRNTQIKIRPVIE